MAISVTKVEVWAGEIADVPGALAKVLGAIAEAGGSLECVIARRHAGKKGRTQVFVSPVKGPKVTRAARGAGLSPSAEMGTLRLEGPNKLGQGAMAMQAIAAAGVNVRGVSGLVIGNKAVAYIGFDSKGDAEVAMKAIKKVK